MFHHAGFFVFSYPREGETTPLGKRKGSANSASPWFGTATEADLNWLPLLTTPPYPSHTSGASTVSGAAGEILKQFYGTDNISFSLTSSVPGIGDRSFTSFSQASQEAADSRMYGGIHFRFEDEGGRDDGIALGQFVFANELRLIPEPGTWILLVFGLVGCLAGRRSGRVS